MNINKLARVYLAALLLTASVGMALAQAPATVQLTITLPEAEIVWKALRKLPVDEVEQIMNKVRQQVADQTQPKAVTSPELTKSDKKDVPTPSKSPD